MAITDQQRTHIDIKYSALAKTARGDRVRLMLESIPIIQAAEGKLWLDHLVYIPTKSIFNKLVCWYLLAEDSLGEVAAKDALNAYLECDVVTTIFSVWVFGVKPDRSYHFEKVSLVPLSEMPDSRERDEYEWLVKNLESPVSHGAFTVEVNLPRIVENGKEAKKVRDEYIQSSFSLLQEQAALVNGINGLSCLPHWECAYQSANIPFGMKKKGVKSLLIVFNILFCTDVTPLTHRI